MRRRLLALLLLLVVSGVVVHTQQATKRLILKDGSYQAVTKYEIQGDRVHYYSAERFGWEDLPKSLVDWDATNKFNANPIVSNTRTIEDREAEAEEAAARARDEAESPTVAPNLRLPETGGVMLLDQYQGRFELNEVLQNGAEVKRNTGKNVLRAVVNPIATSKQSFELDGAHARVQSHIARPTLFINIEQDATTQSLLLSEHYKIVRVEQKEKSRVVGNLNTKFYGKQSQSQKFVPSHAERVNRGPWIKLVPDQDLSPGEYAVVEMLKENEMNLFVWDFGVNPNAPANMASWKPAAPRSETSPEGTPGLQKRP